ncbi:hypothetical protein CBR_g50450 [Chara braunii]|uniref:Kinesin motor domain-containing protein n=1 Tax=Chara braunii TaxID=69332 RepID=A0A388M746_CHABU|nr:hypothetical protein CBR_g50450 [Chara braunii]|eukprot:GBG90272.1 hypothetical protein CBR_g50450 [Chara braunii]
METTILEIYNERVHDLLAPRSADGVAGRVIDNVSIKGKEGQGGEKINHVDVRGGEVVGTLRISESEPKNLMLAIERGIRCCVQACTERNNRSSGSHCMLILRNPEVNDELTIVDMAGNHLRRGQREVDNSRYGRKPLENAERVVVTIEEVKQICAINKDLRAWRRVVDVKVSGDAYVPYCDSKLTELLRESFEGEGRSLMILCVSPAASQIHETIGTLTYGAKAKRIIKSVLVERTEGSEAEKEVETLHACMEKNDSRFKMMKLHETTGRDLEAPALERGRNDIVLLRIEEVSELPLEGEVPESSRRSSGEKGVEHPVDVASGGNNALVGNKVAEPVGGTAVKLNGDNADDATTYDDDGDGRIDDDNDAARLNDVAAAAAVGDDNDHNDDEDHYHDGNDDDDKDGPLNDVASVAADYDDDCGNGDDNDTPALDVAASTAAPDDRPGVGVNAEYMVDDKVDATSTSTDRHFVNDRGTASGIVRNVIDESNICSAERREGEGDRWTLGNPGVDASSPLIDDCVVNDGQSDTIVYANVVGESDDGDGRWELGNASVVVDISFDVNSFGESREWRVC